MWTRVVDAMLPSRCILCSSPAASGVHGLCGPCNARLPRSNSSLTCVSCGARLPDWDDVARNAIDASVYDFTCCPLCDYDPPPLQRMWVFCRYQAPLDRWIPQLKFHNNLALARMLGQLMARDLRRDLRNGVLSRLPDALVPVPLHPSRLRTRGFDQPLEIAKSLTSHLGISLNAQLLKRHRATQRQSELDVELRQSNLRGAFSVQLSRNGALPQHVAILDDVMTTGATLYEAADTLLEAGVRRVDAWVVARADPGE